MERPARAALALIVLAAAAAVVAPRPAASAPGDEPTPEAVKAAIEKGCAWLKTKESDKGSFVVPVVGGGEDPPGKYESKYTDGTTPLALLTLLKCGVKPDDPVINKGFDWLYEQPNRRIYSVALAILAIEARFAPSPTDLEKHKDKPYETVEKQNWRKLARPADVKKVEDLTKWILSKQEKHVWRYPSSGEAENEDHSNTQYAMLALKSASRLGCEVPNEVWERVAQHFVCQQDPTGPEVPFFPVPTADGPISPDKKPEGTTVERGKERPKMFARGWSYLPRPVGDEATPPADPTKPETKEKPAESPKPEAKQPTHQVSTGSMTNSGIVALVVCKSELELRDKAWWKRWGPSVDQGIRDGCAWLAKNFSVEHNPPGRGWKYYYLYGLERAGVMAGTYEFGQHDWYDEGALHLLKLQQADGSWPQDTMLADFTDTCFALLFLKRATVPLVKMPPKRTITGFGGNAPPEPSPRPGKPEKPPLAPEPPKPEGTPAPDGQGK